MTPTRRSVPAASLLLLAGMAGLAGCGGDDEPAGTPTTPGSGSASATPAAPAPPPASTPAAWLTAVCPGGTFSSGEVPPDGRGGPDALNEGYTCAAVPQDGATVYRSIELFTYAADPTSYWAKQAGKPGDDAFVYFAVKQTEAGWFAFVEDDSRTPIKDPVIAAAGGEGFTLHLDG